MFYPVISYCKLKDSVTIHILVVANFLRC